MVLFHSAGSESPIDELAMVGGTWWLALQGRGRSHKPLDTDVRRCCLTPCPDGTCPSLALCFTRLSGGLDRLPALVPRPTQAELQLRG